MQYKNKNDEVIYFNSSANELFDCDYDHSIYFRAQAVAVAVKKVLYSPVLYSMAFLLPVLRKNPHSFGTGKPSDFTQERQKQIFIVKSKGNNFS
ncbi:MULTISPECIES: hypothetical protein [Enterobacteriaceae]|uniref:hypothetical protein n=1 Tax=Citrobacter freundii TaxID=546 RepID=UPI00292B7D33|nr:hypothetical protein [Citrobacter freundii]HEB7853285.1 hypothetical protein [Salmonella enterica subsp. enterica serovar Infantis]